MNQLTKDTAPRRRTSLLVSVFPSSLLTEDLQRRGIYGKGQAHGKEREKPCWQRDCGKGDYPYQQPRYDGNCSPEGKLLTRLDVLK